MIVFVHLTLHYFFNVLNCLEIVTEIRQYAMLMYYMAKYPTLHAKLPAWTYEPLKKDLCKLFHVPYKQTT